MRVRCKKWHMGTVPGTEIAAQKKLTRSRNNPPLHFVLTPLVPWLYAATIQFRK